MRVGVRLLLVGELKKRLKNNDISPLYLVVGTDVVARQQALTLLTDHVCPGELRMWNVQELTGANATAQSVVAAVRTAPFLGEMRLVVLRDFGEMPPPEQAHLVQELQSDQGNVLVIVANALDRRTKVAQELLRQATVVEVAEPGSGNIVSWVQSRARDQEVTMTHSAARRLVDIAGSDTGFLDQEITKMATFLGGRGKVDEELVTRLAARGEAETGQYTIFRLTEAVAEGQTGPALAYLTELLEAGEPPLRVLAMIARQYRLLLLAKSWASEGVTVAAREAGMKQYPMQKLFGQARSLSTEQIEMSLEAILATDIAIKSSVDAVGALQMLVVGLSERKTPDVGDGRLG
jgi:DNA polymerase-3 subunit delta